MDIPEIIKNKLNTTSKPSLEEARQFLRRYWGDETMLDEIRIQMENTVSFSPSSVIRGLEAIEAVLVTPLPDGTLLDMVLWDANYPLDDPSEGSAKAWLKDISEFVRNVLGDRQPPRKTSPLSRSAE
ncbi:hypothetical protein [Nostoc sp.]|uniref:hypothetical protein n=1 Tax=Nostoc sp. TaxID=1180 RepID=UPI002FF6DDC1